MNLFNLLGAEQISGLSKFTGTVKTYLNYVLLGVIGLITLCAIIFAIWVAFKLAKAEDEQKRKEAKNHLIWSIVGIIGAVLIFILVSTVFKSFTTSPGTVGSGVVADQVNMMLVMVSEVINIILGFGTLAGVAFGVYIAFRLATASSEDARKKAKAQLTWTIIAVFAVFVLNAVIGEIMTSLSGYVKAG